MEAARLRRELGQFTGTDKWHRYSPLFRRMLLTDGMVYLCEKAGAFWLADAICSHIFTNRKTFSPQVNPMTFWNLKVAGSKAVLTCSDGGPLGKKEKELARQEIAFTDFPLEEIDVWVCWDTVLEAEGNFVMMLKSEY